MTHFPQADIVISRPSKIPALIIFLVFLTFAGMALFWLFRSSPPDITISFKDSHFLKPGDLLRYRSMAVGEIVAVEPAPDLQTVEVKAVLHPNAGAVAREGSRFWIVRPQINLEGARGLETVLGSHYIRVQPGSGSRQRTFVGLEDQPVLDAIPSGTMEITLFSDRAEGLKPGMQITYRNTPIGVVSGIDLFRNAGGVNARVLIFPQFSPLIVPEAVFCRASGVRFSAGLLEGLSWSVSPLQSMVTSEIHLFVPDLLSQPSSSSRRFPLSDFPPKGAGSWHPSIALGIDAFQASPASLPRPVPLEIPGWGSSMKFIGTGYQDMLILPDLTRHAPKSLTILGKSYEVSVFRHHPEGFWSLQGAFGTASLTPDTQAPLAPGEDLFAIIGQDMQPYFIPEEFLISSRMPKPFKLQPELVIKAEWEGAPVVNRNLRLVGILSNPGGTGKWEILPLPGKPLSNP